MNKKLILAALAVGFVVCVFSQPNDCSGGACRPRRSIAARLIDWAAWLRLAPLNRDPAPALSQPQNCAIQTQPLRTVGHDGFREIDHGNGW